MKVCPKCNYERKAADANAPDWQCPKCGIAYAKFEEKQLDAWAAKQRAGPLHNIAMRPSTLSMTNFVWFLVIVGIAVSASYFAGYRFDTRGSSAPDANPRQPSGEQLPVLLMSPEASEGLTSISTSRVVLFSASWCPHCKTVRSLLQRQGVRFTELDVERDERAAAFQREKMPVVGFPVTVIGNKIVMGSDEGQILAALKSL